MDDEIFEHTFSNHPAISNKKIALYILLTEISLFLFLQFCNRESGVLTDILFLCLVAFLSSKNDFSAGKNPSQEDDETRGTRADFTQHALLASTADICSLARASCNSDDVIDNSAVFFFFLKFLPTFRSIPDIYSA